MLKLISIIFIYTLSFATSANTELLTSNSYKGMTAKLTQFLGQVGRGSTLIVFDIDDTLLHIPNCLPNEGQGIPPYRRWVLVAEKCPVFPAETGLPVLMRELQKQGHHTIALTARGLSLFEKTQEHLKNIDITFNGMPYTTKDNFVEQITTTNKLNFVDGVAFASGTAKGTILKFMQYQRFAHPYQQIIFVDDNIGNIKSVKFAFNNDPRTNVLLINYTRYRKGQQEDPIQPK